MNRPRAALFWGPPFFHQAEFRRAGLVALAAGVGNAA
jgi:hypothetical protein